MSSASKIEVALLSVNLGVILWASMVLPEQWGGPNIGGGFLILLEFAGATAGGYLIVKGRPHQSAG